jgi:hypothetical protein
MLRAPRTTVNPRVASWSRPSASPPSAERSGRGDTTRHRAASTRRWMHRPTRTRSGGGVPTQASDRLGWYCRLRRLRALPDQVEDVELVARTLRGTLPETSERDGCRAHASPSRLRTSLARRAAIVSRPFGQLEAAAGRGTGVRAWSTRGVFPGGLRAVPCDVTPLRREAIVMLARSGQGGAAASRSWRCPLSETARTPMRWRRARNHPGTNATTALFVWHSRCRDRRRTSKFANTYRSTSLASRRGPGFLPRVGEEDSP